LPNKKQQFLNTASKPSIGSLEPLRIAAVPGSTLDVVVKGYLDEKGPSVHENNVAGMNSISSTATTPIGRNPAYGLVEKAMDAYRDNENPSFAPRPRGPQAILDHLPLPQGPHALLDDPSSSLANNMTPTSQTPDSDSKAPAQQDSVSVAKEFAEAIAKARDGDKEAQFTLGNMYKDAQGTPQNYQAAMEWYLKAAAQGHADAHSNIRSLYDQGLGVPQSDFQAVEWYQKAVDQGSPGAQLKLAAMYEQGQGVPKDKAEAVKWYKKVGDKGQAEAKRFEKRRLRKLLH
jgi:TPR repeat protein